LNVHLIPRFGEARIDAIDAAAIASWRDQGVSAGRLSRRNANKLLAVMQQIFVHGQRRHGLIENPAALVPRLTLYYDSARYRCFAPQQVRRLAAAAASEQDTALYITAAFTGLRRGELLALRWCAVDFEHQAIKPADGDDRDGSRPSRARVVPMVDEVAGVLGRRAGRSRYVGADDLVFPNRNGETIPGSAVTSRCSRAAKCAGLPSLRFDDLRHTFGSVAVKYAPITQVQEWMGHADINTTLRYLTGGDDGCDARVLSNVFWADESDRTSTPEVPHHRRASRVRRTRAVPTARMAERHSARSSE
jgi:integrase